MKRRIIRRVRPAGAAAGQQGGLKLVNTEIVNKFNPSILGLGDINAPCEEIEAVAAVFDLSGFTAFCNQVDSYLAIPSFLNNFFDWFFGSIVYGLTDDIENRTYFWADLPILVKFTGDGVIVVWNARNMKEDQICRLAATLYNVCYAYRQDFYPQIYRVVNKPPSVLRCGLARGKVFSVGNGHDFIGHCINTASRLGGLNPLTFCFPHRGFGVQEYMPPEYAKLFVPKYVSVRGVGDNELVWVVKEEFDNLPERNKMIFRSLEAVPA
ncbi:MAG: nucleotidyl cyclase domain-containing protein [Dehalococcoidales bacterium]